MDLHEHEKQYDGKFIQPQTFKPWGFQLKAEYFKRVWFESSLRVVHFLRTFF